MRITFTILLLVRAFIASLALTGIALAQTDEPIRIGLLTVKTGPLATGGIQMEQGLNVFLEEHRGHMAGRPVELFVADTGGSPAIAKTKAQELVERDGVDAIIGPLAAYEALAINDYIAEVGVPTLSIAAAEDMTQRTPNPYFVRASSTFGAGGPSDGSLCRRRSRLSGVPCNDRLTTSPTARRRSRAFNASSRRMAGRSCSSSGHR